MNWHPEESSIANNAKFYVAITILFVGSLVRGCVAKADGPGSDIKLPSIKTLDDFVDTIEYNNKFKEDGTPQFDQLIFWEDGHVRAWRMVKTKKDKNGDLVPCGRNPYPSRSDRGYELIMERGSFIRRIFSKEFKITHTKTDPERDDCEEFPQHKRKGLKNKDD